jgi:hypothetical protein
MASRQIPDYQTELPTKALENLGETFGVIAFSDAPNRRLASADFHVFAPPTGTPHASNHLNRPRAPARS